MASGVPSLKVTWNTPQSDWTISLYWVQYRKQGTASWSGAPFFSVSPPATSTDLTGLDVGTEYTVRVKAVSVVGAGTWSVAQIEKTFDCEFLYCIICCYQMHLHMHFYIVWQLWSLSVLHV